MLGIMKAVMFAWVDMVAFMSVPMVQVVRVIPLIHPLLLVSAPKDRVKGMVTVQ